MEPALQSVVEDRPCHVQDVTVVMVTARNVSEQALITVKINHAKDVIMAE